MSLLASNLKPKTAECRVIQSSQPSIDRDNVIKANPRLIREMQTELFQKQGQGWFRIVSGSMRPLIDVEDRIFAKGVSATGIKPGDIILFKTAEAQVTHRVVKIARQNGRTAILQKGDAGAYSSTIPLGSVMGRVTAIEKNGRILSLEKGRIRLLNTVLGIKNCRLYRFDKKMSLAKGWLRNKPGFRYLRAVYRMFKMPFGILNQKKIVDRITAKSIDS